MFGYLVRIAVTVLVLMPATASAEPVTLKLAFFSSDRSHPYRAAVKPFVDAVNAEGKGRVEIVVSFSGSLGGDVTKQSQLVREGKADIAYVVVPYEAASFPDSEVIELPGLFQDAREATLVFSHLVETGKMHEFDDFFVVGVSASQPESIHSRTPIESIADQKGKRIRANNEDEIAVLKRLGAIPVFVPINETADAVSSGRIDGAYVPPVPMIEFGIGRVATYHYLLRTSSVPLALLMNRKRLESLPDEAQAIIRKYSGDWLARQWIQMDKSSTALVMNQLKSNPGRKVTLPSKADMRKAQAVFESVIDDYVAGNPRRAALVGAARTEVARLRRTQ
jgi:TRAP-type C4-dicarboxylate transport system substrate-binding protein